MIRIKLGLRIVDGRGAIGVEFSSPKASKAAPQGSDPGAQRFAMLSLQC
jgi:hypothetical protein